MSSIEAPLVKLPLLAIAGSVCWECSEAERDGTSLSRCKGCKRAVYCSSECQKRNWASQHSVHCKALRRLNAGPKALERITWENYQALQRRRYNKIIKRDEPGATNLANALLDQPKCETCLRTPFDQVDTQTFRLTPCVDCKLAFFCSVGCRAEGLEQHRQKQCSILKDIGACELVKISHTKATGDPIIRLPTEKPRHTYRPLHTAKSWKVYLEDISNSPFANFITEDFSPANGDKASLQACRFLKVAAESSSLILTILAGLESEISDLSSRKKLTIHIVGADIIELSAASVTEELYHLLPELQTLVVGYVGPDVESAYGNTTKLVDLGYCPECRKMGRSPRQAFMVDDLYHDFAKSELFSKYPPDLIVAFNSGHAESEIQSWWPTLKCILDLEIPAVFTTYNKSEAIGEGKIFEGMGAQFSRKPVENPWRGVLAQLEHFEERYDVYYSNYYWYIVRGRTHG